MDLQGTQRPEELVPAWPFRLSQSGMLLDGRTDRFHGLAVRNQLSSLGLSQALFDFPHSFFGVIESVTQNKPQHLFRRSPRLFSQSLQSCGLNFRNNQ